MDIIVAVHINRYCDEVVGQSILPQFLVDLISVSNAKWRLRSTVFSDYFDLGIGQFDATSWRVHAHEL